MNRAILFLAFLQLPCSSVFSNPVLEDPYTLVGITEVYIPRPDEWYIELDGQKCLFDSGNANFPCSTDLYLRIAGSPYNGVNGIYRARVGFGKNYYGVITPSSLIDINKALLIPLSPMDTIAVARDTAKGSKYASLQGLARYWRFPLKPVSSGNVLVALRINADTLPEVYETSRKSIGYPGNYTTSCLLSLLDGHNVPIAGISATATPLSIGRLDNAGTFKIETSLLRPTGTVKFEDPCNAHPYSYSSALIPDYSVIYSDKDSVTYDTLRLKVTRYMLTVKNGLDNPVDNSCFYSTWPPVTGSVVPFRYRKLTPLAYKTPDTWFFRIYESVPPETLYVTWDVYANYPDSIDCLATWSGAYRDTADTIKESVIIDPATSDRRKTPHTAPSAATVSVLVESNRSLCIIVKSPRAFTDAVAALYTISGRKISSIPLEIRPGTSITRFRFSNERLSKGTYLCRLTIDGYAPVFRQITIP